MSKIALNLQSSEAVIVQTAGIIYTAFIQSGQNTLETDDHWVEKSVQIALDIAKKVDNRVRCDREVG